MGINQREERLNIDQQEEEGEEIQSSNNNAEDAHNVEVQVVLNNIEVNSNEDLIAEQAEDDPGEVEVPEQQSDHQIEGRKQCSICKKEFKAYNNLTQHMRCVHKPKKKCPYCEKLVVAPYFKRHVNEAHKGATVKCPECKKDVRASLLSQHMGLVHVFPKVKCPQCSKFMVSSALARHIEEVHEGQRKECPHCAKNIQASQLLRHIKTVHLRLKKKCPHCDKKFTSSSLYRHIKRIHQGGNVKDA